MSMQSTLRWLAYPQALLLLAVLPLLANLALLAWLGRRRGWQRLGSQAALQTLSSLRPGRRFWRGLLIAVGLLLVGAAAAGPQWGRQESEVVSAARDLVVVLDVSRSMLAETPSRQLRAQRVLVDLANTLKLRGGHRVALVACAARAEVVVPLTTDYDLFRDAVLQQDAARLPEELRPTRDSVSGTRLGEGIQQALAAHDEKYRGSQVIVLVSDGDDPAGDDGEWKDGATAARRLGVPVFTVGVGDPARPSKIRLTDGSLLKFDGNFVETRLEEEVLKEIAQRTDGTYFPLRTADAASGTLFPAILQAAAARPRETSPINIYRPRFRWFLGLGFGCLLASLFVGERRVTRSTLREGELVVKASEPLTVKPVATAAAVAMTALMLLGAAPLPADDALRQGNDAIQRKDYESALRHYEQAEVDASDPGLVAFNKGAALFRLGRLREAELCYLRCLQDRAIPAERRRKALYDLGVALLQRGADMRDSDALRRAVEAFELFSQEANADQKLQDDAEYNLELARLLWRKVRTEKRSDDKQDNEGDGNKGKSPNKTPNQSGEDGGADKDPGTGPLDKAQAGDRKIGDTDRKMPGAGNVQALPDRDQLQSMDANDALERLAREIRRIERQQAEAMGSTRDSTGNVKDW
jgi:Ca-activated chloride channel family protein